MAGTKTRWLAGGPRRAGLVRPDLSWSPFARAEKVFSVSAPGRFAVLSIILAMLFCHGAFGYAHQVSPMDVREDGGAHPAHAVHEAGVHQAGQDGDAEGTHVGGAYFATLMVLLFGAALLAGRAVPAGGRLAVPGPGMDRGVWRLRPPRGPTASRLQVFRL